MREPDIMRLIQIEASSRGHRLFRNNVGMLRDDRGIMVRFGLGVGTSDLIGWHYPSGRFLAVEVKTPTGILSKDQENFVHQVNQSGGIAFVARSPEEFIEKIKDK